MTAAFVIDVDAAQRESQFPDGIPIVFKGETFTLPAELPLDVFDPVLSADFDLVGLVRTLFDSEANDAGGMVTELLTARPGLPLEFRDTIYDCLQLLWGEEQWKSFLAKRPGLPTLIFIVKGLVKAYGITLGEAFASLGSFVGAGATQKLTSPSSTEGSTPEASGGETEPAPATSESDVSAT